MQRKTSSDDTRLRAETKHMEHQQKPSAQSEGTVVEVVVVVVKVGWLADVYFN